MVDYPIKIGRTRPTHFGMPPPSWALAKIPLLFGGLSAALLILGRKSDFLTFVVSVAVLALLAILAYRAVYLIKRKSYANTPGAIVYADRVQLNGDGGPRAYPWSDFGSAFLSELNGRPIVQHLAVSDLHLDGYPRFSSYMLTPVDYLALQPEEFLALLKAQSGFPRNAENA